MSGHKKLVCFLMLMLFVIAIPFRSYSQCTEKLQSKQVIGPLHAEDYAAVESAGLQESMRLIQRGKTALRGHFHSEKNKRILFSFSPFLTQTRGGPYFARVQSPVRQVFFTSRLAPPMSRMVVLLI